MPWKQCPSSKGNTPHGHRTKCWMLLKWYKKMACQYLLQLENSMWATSWLCINLMAARAFPLTIPIIKSFALAISKRSGEEERFYIDDGPGKSWWQQFQKRHDLDITVWKEDKLDRGRASMANPKVIFEFFDKLKDVLTDLDVVDQPEYLTWTDMDWISNYGRERL